MTHFFSRIGVIKFFLTGTPILPWKRLFTKVFALVMFVSLRKSKQTGISLRCNKH